MSTNNKLAKQLHRHILMRTEIRRGDRVCLNFYMTATGFPTKDEILRTTVQIFFIPFSYINVFLLFTFCQILY